MLTRETTSILRGAFIFALLASVTSARATVIADTSGLAILKYNHPGLVTDLGVGLWAWPLPMDYDNDGDPDLLVSCTDKPFNGIWLFENKTGGHDPVFEPPVRLTQGVRNIQISFVNERPRVLIPGFEFADFEKKLLGDSITLAPPDLVLGDLKKSPRFNQWRVVDYDNDGDEDLIIGVDDWGDYGWDNAYDAKGKWTNGPLHGYVYLVENVDGKYVNKGKVQAGGEPIDVYGAPSPNFADFDNDGDLDLICGEFLDKLTWFENTGTRENPVYRKGRLLKNNSGIIRMDLEMIVPVAYDWNGDGLIDLIIGDEDGRVALMENTGKIVDRMPVFKSPVYFRQKADNVKFGALITPVGVDWDEDGDEDIIAGNSAGYIAFIENLGTHDGMPRWETPVKLEANGEVIRIQAGSNGSIQGPAEAKWGYTTLSVADWDQDGRLDIIVNSIWGKVVWFRNKGPVLDAARPVEVEWGSDETPKPSWTWWTPQSNTLATQWRTTPVAYDWNGDGLTDLVMLDHEGYLALFERFRKGKKLYVKPPARIFYGADYSGYDQRHAVRDSIPGPLRLNTREFGSSGRRKFCIADWNRDGRPDLLVNSLNVSVLENTKTADGVSHFSFHPPLFNDILAGHTTSPTVVDWNKDGIFELLIGAEDGHLYYQGPSGQ